MARLSGIERTDDVRFMGLMGLEEVQNYYKDTNKGWEVNDGQFLNFIDDREEADEQC